jgi:hypothetical protein
MGVAGVGLLLWLASFAVLVMAWNDLLAALVHIGSVGLMVLAIGWGAEKHELREFYGGVMSGLRAEAHAMTALIILRVWAVAWPHWVFATVVMICVVVAAVVACRIIRHNARR